eukprot:scaffold28537_cov33-Tisochrysis_lutea.AAC.1
MHRHMLGHGQGASFPPGSEKKPFSSSSNILASRVALRLCFVATPLTCPPNLPCGSFPCALLGGSGCGSGGVGQHLVAIGSTVGHRGDCSCLLADGVSQHRECDGRWAFVASRKDITETICQSPSVTSAPCGIAIHWGSVFKGARIRPTTRLRSAGAPTAPRRKMHAVPGRRTSALCTKRNRSRLVIFRVKSLTLDFARLLVLPPPHIPWGSQTWSWLLLSVRPLLLGFAIDILSERTGSLSGPQAAGGL